MLEEDLIELDLMGINDYFRTMRPDEFGHKTSIPPTEEIIAESFKIKINDIYLRELKAKSKEIYKMNNEQKKIKRKEKQKKK